MKNYIHLLATEFSGYTSKDLMKDLLAGVTVAAVALPLALAFGVSSGVTASAGLVTAILSGFIISAFSSGSFQISGPTGTIAAILITIAATYGLTGIFIATLLSGIILVIAGLLKLGIIGSLLPSSVITGFTSGIGIIIALSQVDAFFGVSSIGLTPIEQLTSYINDGFPIDPQTVIIGLFVMVLMIFYPKKINNYFPAALASIILATLLSTILNFKIATVGRMPSSLITNNRLHFTDIDLNLVSELFAPAISIALLVMIESLLSGAAASKMTGEVIDNNQELVVQGAANILSPFLGGIPATTAIARTSVAIKSGAKTRLAGVFHALFLLFAFFVLAPFIALIPLSALAGVLFITSWRMNDWENIRYLFKHRLGSGIVTFIVTMLSTVLIDLTWAIIIGTMLSLIRFILVSAKISIASESVDPSRMGFSNTKNNEKWQVIYITGPLFFASATTLERTLRQLDDKQHVIFSLRGVPSVDITASRVLSEFYDEQINKGNEVIFASINPIVREQLTTTGLHLIENKNYYPSVDKFLTNILI